MKKYWFWYFVPNLYLILWLQWFSYGLFSTAICFALWLLSFVPALHYGRQGKLTVWLRGSLLQFVMNISLTLLTMQWNPESPHGGSWNGITGVLWSHEFVIALSVFTLFLQLFFVAPLVAGARRKE